MISLSYRAIASLRVRVASIDPAENHSQPFELALTLSPATVGSDSARSVRGSRKPTSTAALKLLADTLSWSRV